MKLRNNLTMYSLPPPGSGVLTAYIMRILDDGHLDGSGSCRDPVTYHRIAEAFKHAFAQRTKLGDPRFHPEVNEVGPCFSIKFKPKKKKKDADDDVDIVDISVEQDLDFRSVRRRDQDENGR